MARIAQRTQLLGAALFGVVAAGLTRAIVRRARRLDLTGKVVIVTGGSRGLGLLLAQEFGRRGAKVAIAGRDRAAVEEAERLLQRKGVDVLARPCDLGDRQQAELFIERVTDEWGRIDVLVNNAGVIQVGPFEEVTLESLEEVMHSNFWSAANTTLCALPHLRERAPHARIVNIVSFGGRVAVPHLLGYSASKFALMGFSEALRAELARFGVKVTSVIPGIMRTGSFYNAQFLGKSRREFEWFSLGSSLPLLSLSADSAARRVVDAAVEGRAELHLGLPAHIISFLHGVAPRFVGGLLSLINRALPEAADVPGEVCRGREFDSPLERSPLLFLGNAAARKNNEAPPETAY